MTTSSLNYILLALTILKVFIIFYKVFSWNIAKYHFVSHTYQLCKSKLSKWHPPTLVVPFHKLRHRYEHIFHFSSFAWWCRCGFSFQGLLWQSSVSPSWFLFPGGWPCWDKAYERLRRLHANNRTKPFHACYIRASVHGNGMLSSSM